MRNSDLRLQTMRHISGIAILVWAGFIGGFILAQRPIQAALFILYGVIAKHLSGRPVISGSGSIPIGH